MGREHDASPEDARAFARWNGLGRECDHDGAETTLGGQCVRCLQLADDARTAGDDGPDARKGRYRVGDEVAVHYADGSKRSGPIVRIVRGKLAAKLGPIVSKKRRGTPP